MLRYLVFPFAIGLVVALHAADLTRKVAYARSGTLFVANLDGSSAHKMGTGAWPDLSPDGTRVAFNTEDPGGKSPDRRIVLAEVATGKVTRLPNIPSTNCHSPVWSPDGKRILFQIHAEDDWHIGLIGTDGSDFKYVKRAGAKNHSFYSIAWAPDGKSFYCQDLDIICRVGVEGDTQKKWEISKLFPNGGMSSGGRLAPSPDGRTLLVDVEMDEDVMRTDWDGPPPAIWSLDMSSGQATRITPKGVFAWQPCWLTSDAFLCSLQPASASRPSIYRMSADGRMRQALIKDAESVSVSH